MLFVLIFSIILQDDEQLAYISKLEMQLKEMASQLENTTQRIDSVIREVGYFYSFVLKFPNKVGSYITCLFLVTVGARVRRLFTKS